MIFLHLIFFFILLLRLCPYVKIFYRLKIFSQAFKLSGFCYVLAASAEVLEENLLLLLGSSFSLFPPSRLPLIKGSIKSERWAAADPFLAAPLVPWTLLNHCAIHKQTALVDFSYKAFQDHRQFSKHWEMPS